MENKLGIQENHPEELKYTFKKKLI